VDVVDLSFTSSTITAYFTFEQQFSWFSWIQIAMDKIVRSSLKYLIRLPKYELGKIGTTTRATAAHCSAAQIQWSHVRGLSTDSKDGTMCRETQGWWLSRWENIPLYQVRNQLSVEPSNSLTKSHTVRPLKDTFILTDTNSLVPKTSKLINFLPLSYRHLPVRNTNAHLSSFSVRPMVLLYWKDHSRVSSIQYDWPA